MINKSMFDKEGHFVLPKPVKETKLKHQRDEFLKEFLSYFADNVSFQPDVFFKTKRFVGSCVSKRNKYYVYSDGNVYFVTTGIRTKINYNIITNDEVEVVREFLSSIPAKSFTMKKLLSSLSLLHTDVDRLKTFIDDYNTTEKDVDQRRYLYSLVLEICYVLCSLGELDISLKGKEIKFSKCDISPIDEYDIFSNISFVTRFDRLFLFKDKKFYFTLQYKNMRGSVFPYLIDEINYLTTLVEKYDKNQQINIVSLIQEMDYQQRFNEIYNMIMEQNLRNEREKTDYFYSRIKAALKIVHYLTQKVKVGKDGRRIKFIRC